MRIIIIILTFIAVLFTTNNELYSFKRTVQILVKGTVIDEFTGKPVGASLEFRLESGRKFKINSNSISGEFEQVFNSGEKVQVVISNWDIARKTEEFVVKDTAAYSEQSVDFFVRKFEVDSPIFKFNLFEQNSSNFVNDYKAILDSLEQTFRFSRNIKVELRVNARDSYWKTEKLVQQEKPKVKSTKKKQQKTEVETRTIIESPNESAVKSLVDSRIVKLAESLGDWTKNRNRITVGGDTNIFLASQTQNNIFTADVEVIITELQEVLR